MSKQYRQGDVLLVKTRYQDLPGATRMPRDQGRVILTLGEATGHAHAIASAHAALLEVANGERYLLVDGPAELTHEEHAAIGLEPGLYRVVRQREYGPGVEEYVRG